MDLKCVGIFLSLILLIGLAYAQSDYCGVQTLYFQHNESDDITGYESLVNFPSGMGAVDENITIKNTDGPVLIDAYIMPAGSLEHVTSLRKGLRVFTTFHYVDSTVGTTRINFTAFQRFQNGTEVTFYSQLSDDINALDTQDYTTYRVSTQDLNISPTDRLGIKIYGQTTHSSPVKLHFVYQGTSNVSSFQSGYFVCEEHTVSNTGGEAIGILFGVLGGIVGALIISRRLK